MSNNQKHPDGIIDIPQISNDDLFQSNRDKADEYGLNHCPCCGKAIANPKFFINSIFGGCAYPANDRNEYRDAWVMGVGSECRKKFPQGYVFSIVE